MPRKLVKIAQCDACGTNNVLGYEGIEPEVYGVHKTPRRMCRFCYATPFGTQAEYTRSQDPIKLELQGHINKIANLLVKILKENK